MFHLVTVKLSMKIMIRQSIYMFVATQSVQGSLSCSNKHIVSKLTFHIYR